MLAVERLATVVVMEAIDVPRHNDLQELFRALVRLRLVDMDRVDLTGENVADRADDDVALFVESARAVLLLDPTDDHLPQAEQVREVARQVPLGAVRARRAYDKPEPLRRIELTQDAPEPLAVVFVLDLARDADPPKSRHQDQVPAGDTDVS